VEFGYAAQMQSFMRGWFSQSLNMRPTVKGDDVITAATAPPTPGIDSC